LTKFGDEGLELSFLLTRQAFETEAVAFDPLVAEKNFAGFGIGYASEREIPQKDPIVVNQRKFAVPVADGPAFIHVVKGQSPQTDVVDLVLRGRVAIYDKDPICDTVAFLLSDP
jgi:hypothetical protein